MTSTPQAGAAANQTVNAVNAVNHVNAVNAAIDDNHVNAVNAISDADFPQYDESRAWLFELIISIENSDDE